MFLRPSFLVAIAASVLVSVATEASAKDFQRFSTGIDAVQFTDAGGRQLKGSKSCKASRRLNGKQRRAKSSTGGGSSFCCEEGDWFCACISFFYSLFRTHLGGRRLGEGETCMMGEYDEAFSTVREEALEGLQESGLFTAAGNMVLSCVSYMVNPCDFAKVGMFVLEKTEEEWQTILEEAKADAKDTLGDCVPSEENEGEMPVRRLDDPSCVTMLKNTIISFAANEMFPESVSTLVGLIHYIPIGFMLNGGEPIDDEETSMECTDDHEDSF